MEGIEKSLSFAEGMVQAEQTAVVSTDGNERSCLNCKTPLTDVYCPHCGQKDIPRRQTLGELLMNFISSFWSYESKFFKTGQYLLFKPGFLAVEYTEGRRERYYHPARMYVFISFIYFLLFSIQAGNADENVKWKSDGTNVGKVDDIKDGPFSSREEDDYRTRAQYDSAQQALPPGERDGWFRRMAEYREIELHQKYEGKGRQFIYDVREAFIADFSKVIFFLLPVFALLLKLLYIRRDFFYSEHLVFSIFSYNLFFLGGSVIMIVELVPWLQWLGTLIGIWLFVYMLLAMKRMYKQGWAKTITKYFAFGFVFSLCVMLGFAIDLLIILIYI
jgi:hypothetical protein